MTKEIIIKFFIIYKLDTSLQILYTVKISLAMEKKPPSQTQNMATVWSSTAQLPLDGTRSELMTGTQGPKGSTALATWLTKTS